jgi:hypothetical protein
MEVLTVISQIKTSTQALLIMGVDGTPSHLHINDFKTNKNSTMTPLSAIREVLNKIEGLVKYD